MGRFLRKIKRMGKKVLDGEDVVAQVQAKIASVVSSSVLDANAVQSLQSNAKQVHHQAKTTINICEETEEQRRKMIAFAEQIRSTMKGLGSSDGEDSGSRLHTIRDLVDGQRLSEAMDMVTMIQASATKCVDTSVDMIDKLEDGIDQLPDVVKRGMDQWVDDSDDDEDEDDEEDVDRFIEEDVRDVQQCIDALHKLDLGNCMLVGLRAFESLSQKSLRSQEMFESIKSFAGNIDKSMDSLSRGQVVGSVDNVKDLWKCLQMTSEMKVLANAAGKLLDIILRLFQATAERISQLWAALAFAKECVEECVEHVHDAKERCLQARDQSTSFMERTRIVQETVEASTEVSPESIRALQGLRSEITQLIKVAKSMDEYALECNNKVVHMVTKVSEGFTNMPEILTMGVDLENDGFNEDDERPPDIAKDIQELEDSRETIRQADVFGAAQAGVQGFATLRGKADLCRGTLDHVTAYSRTVDTVLLTFVNFWNLEAAYTKIKEMCRIVSLGDLMKRFVSQIKDFAKAMIALLKATIDNFGSLDITMIASATAGRVTDKVSNAVDKVEDQLDNLADRLKDKFSFI